MLVNLNSFPDRKQLLRRYCWLALPTMIHNNQVIEKLKTIYDPEIPVNIYDLGLIYAITITGNKVHVLMTLTTATCPAAAFLSEEVALVVHEIPDVEDVNVEVVYEPKWTREMMRPEAREVLGFD